jgi:hypothetical protein
VSILEFIAGLLMKWLAGWIGARQASKQMEHAHEEQTAAVTDAATARDRSDADIEASRTRSADVVSGIRAADGASDAGRVQYNAVQAAIDRANGGVQ